jgi:RNA polymerase sigma-70 factor (ECF subfamily)
MPAPVSDCSLLNALRARDKDACEAFVDGHYRGVHRFLSWLTGDADAAADLTQETFAAFWQSLDHVNAPDAGDLKAWLYGIARNRWRKRRRDARRLAMSLDEIDELQEQTPGPQALALLASERERVVRAVADLPPDYREALALRVFEELSYREIARALAINENLARWRAHQARRMLAARLTDEERDGGSPR